MATFEIRTASGAESNGSVIGAADFSPSRKTEGKDSDPKLAALGNQRSIMRNQKPKPDFNSPGSIPPRQMLPPQRTSAKQRKQQAHPAPVRRAAGKVRG